MGTVFNGKKWKGACVNGKKVSGLVKNGMVFFRGAFDSTPPHRLSTNFYLTRAGNITEQYARPGDTLVINSKFDEELKQNPKFYYVNGGNYYEVAQVEKALENNTYLYKCETVLPDNLEQGNITIFITDIEDLAGNKGTDITSATNGRVMIYDSILPTFNIGNGNAFSSKEIIATDTNFDYMIVRNNKTGVEETIDENSWLLNSGNAQYKFTAYDKAGNYKEVWVYHDDTVPVFEGIGKVDEVDTTFSENGTYQSLTLTISDNDLSVVEQEFNSEKTTLASYTWDNHPGSASFTFTEEGTYTIIAIDRAGNTKEVSFIIAKSNIPSETHSRRIMVNDNLRNKRIYADFPNNYYTNLDSRNVDIIPTTYISVENGSFVEYLDDSQTIGDYTEYFSGASAFVVPQVRYQRSPIDESETIVEEGLVNNDKDYIVSSIISDNDSYKHIFVEDSNIRPFEIGDVISENTKIYFTVPDNIDTEITDNNEVDRIIVLNDKSNYVSGLYIADKICMLALYVSYGTSTIFYKKQDGVLDTNLSSAKDSRFIGIVKTINTESKIYPYVLVDKTTLGT